MPYPPTNDSSALIALEPHVDIHLPIEVRRQLLGEHAPDAERKSTMRPRNKARRGLPFLVATDTNKFGAKGCSLDRWRSTDAREVDGLPPPSENHCELLTLR